MQDDRSATDGQGRDGSPTTVLPTIVHAVAGADGTLAVQYTDPITGEVFKLTFTANGDYSLLRLRDGVWREVDISFAAGPRSRGPALVVRAAASQPDGTVKATLTSMALRGQRIRRSLQLEADGSWSSDYDQRQSTGQRIIGTATTKGNADGRVTRQQQMLNAAGETLWTAETSTELVSGRLNQAGIGWVGSPVPMLRRIGKTTYPDGGVGSTDGYVLLSSTGKATTDASSAVYRQTVTDSGPGWKRTTTTTTQDLFKQEIVSVTKFDNGRVITTVEHIDGVVEIIHGTPLVGPKRIDFSTETVFPDGSKSVTREKASSSWGEKRPDIDPGGEASGSDGLKMHTDSWEKVTIDRDGSRSEERGAETHSAAGVSRSTSETKADGTVVITTTTTDNNGNGTRHTSTVDKNGRITDKDEPIGSGGGGGTPPRNDGEHADGSNGSSDPDNGSGEDSPLGDEMGPSGGGGRDDDGPMRLLPGHAGRAFGSSIIIDDPLSDPDGDEARSIPAQMAAGLTYDAMVNPGVAYGDQGDELGGGAGHLGVRPGSQATMILDTVPVPPEEEFQWDNPEVQYAFAAAMVAALRSSGRLDAKHLDLIESNLAGVTTFADRLSKAGSISRQS